MAPKAGLLRRGRPRESHTVGHSRGTPERVYGRKARRTVQRSIGACGEAGLSGISARAAWAARTFEPEIAGLEGQYFIQAKLQARGKPDDGALHKRSAAGGTTPTDYAHRLAAAASAGRGPRPPVEPHEHA